MDGASRVTRGPSRRRPARCCHRASPMYRDRRNARGCPIESVSETETETAPLLRRLAVAAGLPGDAVLDELDVQAERLQLLDEHVEALGHARLQRVVALDDGLVHPGA